MDVEELKVLLRKGNYTEEEYVKILDLFDLRVLPGSVDVDPPLSTLQCAVQGILYPTLSFNHIPDLIDILCQVERAREFSLEHAKWALIWQRFYETRPNPNVRVLQKADKDILRKFLKPEPRLAETGLSCFRFMSDAKRWEEQRLRELDVSILPDSYYDDDDSFQVLKSKFIGNIEIADIAESITLYLKKVLGMEQKLHCLLARQSLDRFNDPRILGLWGKQSFTSHRATGSVAEMLFNSRGHLLFPLSFGVFVLSSGLRFAPPGAFGAPVDSCLVDPVFLIGHHQQMVVLPVLAMRID
ncbi:hypothetical protein BC826DRAFT_643617 [Russula brevipes]|nr:hypothetical protein BC826DRAFT_643617 [Russula brevipes]